MAEAQDDSARIESMNEATSLYDASKDTQMLREQISDDNERHTYASQLNLAKNIAYTDLKDGQTVNILDEDGQRRDYQVKNIATDKGLVCTALIPPNDHPNPDVKILFRGTHSKDSAIMDIEPGGPGNKTMTENRKELLKAVDSIVLQTQQDTGKPVSMTIAGHSLGGALTERFTSEVNQAIYYENNPDIEPNQEAILAQLQEQRVWDNDPGEQKKMAKSVADKMAKNKEEFEGEHFEGLRNLKSIKSMGANSARLSSEQARIGDGFVTLNSTSTDIKSEIRNYKADGDIVSQMAERSLGSGLSGSDAVSVSLLKKDAGYKAKDVIKSSLKSPIKSISNPIDTVAAPFKATKDAHSSHALLDEKNSDKQKLTFYDQENNTQELEKKLSSTNSALDAGQKLFNKSASPFARLFSSQKEVKSEVTQEQIEASDDNLEKLYSKLGEVESTLESSEHETEDFDIEAIFQEHDHPAITMQADHTSDKSKSKTQPETSKVEVEEDKDSKRKMSR